MEYLPYVSTEGEVVTEFTSEQDAEDRVICIAYVGTVILDNIIGEHFKGGEVCVVNVALKDSPPTMLAGTLSIFQKKVTIQYYNNGWLMECDYKQRYQVRILPHDNLEVSLATHIARSLGHKNEHLKNERYNHGRGKVTIAVR